MIGVATMGRRMQPVLVKPGLFRDRREAGRRARTGHRSGSDANLTPIMVAAHARTCQDTDQESAN
jgi:hypothetical protein